jgi:hypothetical protein
VPNAQRQPFSMPPTARPMRGQGPKLGPVSRAVGSCVLAVSSLRASRRGANLPAFRLVIGTVGAGL